MQAARNTCPWRIPTLSELMLLAILILLPKCPITVLRLAMPRGARCVLAESVLVKHQLLILNRGRKRAPNLRPADRIIAGLGTFLWARPVFFVLLSF